MSRTGSSTEGFTLLEVLVAMAVVGLAAASAGLALPSLLGRLALDRAETGLVSVLTSARSRAIATRRTVVLVFDHGSRRLSATDGAGPYLVPEGLDLTVAGARISDANRPALFFLADGSSSGGRLTLSRGDERRRLALSLLGGRVTDVRE